MRYRGGWELERLPGPQAQRLDVAFCGQSQRAGFFKGILIAALCCGHLSPSRRWSCSRGTKTVAWGRKAPRDQPWVPPWTFRWTGVLIVSVQPGKTSAEKTTLLHPSSVNKRSESLSALICLSAACTDGVPPLMVSDPVRWNGIRVTVQTDQTGLARW